MLTLEFSVTHVIDGHSASSVTGAFKRVNATLRHNPFPSPRPPSCDKSWSLRHYITGLSTMYPCLLPAPTRHERAGKGTIPITPVNRVCEYVMGGRDGWMDGWMEWDGSRHSATQATAPLLKHLETLPSVSAYCRGCTAAVISANYNNAGRGRWWP
jgi:hypothetical protein